MKKLLVNIFTNELVWMGQIDSVKSLVHRSSWHEIPNSELTISKTAQGVGELQVGRILVVNNQRDKALIIEDFVATLDDDYITFTCIPMKGMLNYRIVHPQDSANGLAWTQRKQSQVMTWIMYDNLMKQTRDPDRYFQNTARTKNMLQMATESAREFGDIIDYKVDWNTGLMGDAITSVAKMYGVDTTVPLGWNIYITENYDAFEFDVYHGTHKHIHQVTLPPVVFSEEFGNIKNATYEYSIKDWRNVAYMTWNNGTSDVNTPVGNASKGATVSFNRKEIIISSSKEVQNEVVSEGKSELNKRPHVESFNAEIINNENTMSTYKKDWDLGDIVTVQSNRILKDTLITIDSQITEIEETYDSGEYTISATFGEGKLSFVQLIKQSIDQK
jgi:Siphovirus ReqiPepy6 Gp37-like protein